MKRVGADKDDGTKNMKYRVPFILYWTLSNLKIILNYL